MERSKAAGVNLDEGDPFVNEIRPLVRSTFRPEVMRDARSFGAMFSIPSGRYKDIVLVSSTNGVGTKLRIAQMIGVHETIGIDLVAINANDILVQGAEPLFFLDYYGTGRLRREVAVEVIRGIAAGCRQAGCALVGGETAEMPGIYGDDLYDLAGFVVGAVEREKRIDGNTVAEGQTLVGLASSGLHSSGFGLVRHILLEEHGLPLGDCPVELGGLSLAEVLLTPSRIYVRSVLQLSRDHRIHSLVHVTEGGLVENVPRILPERCQALFDRSSWPLPPIFSYLRRLGRISREELYRVFNMGLGMVLVVPTEQSDAIVARLNELGEQAFRVGEIVRRASGAPAVAWSDG